VGASPTGQLIGFRFPDTIGQWGEERFVLVTADAGLANGGLFITTDNGLTWTKLGSATAPPTGGPFMCAVQVAFDPRTPVPIFYVQVGLCETDNRGNRDQLWRFVGTDPSGTWERITFPDEAEGSGVSLFAVDRSNSNRLYASLVFPLDTSQNPTRNPQMIF